MFRLIKAQPSWTCVAIVLLLLQNKRKMPEMVKTMCTGMRAVLYLLIGGGQCWAQKVMCASCSFNGRCHSEWFVSLVSKQNNHQQYAIVPSVRIGHWLDYCNIKYLMNPTNVKNTCVWVRKWFVNARVRLCRGLYFTYFCFVGFNIRFIHQAIPLVTPTNNGCHSLIHATVSHWFIALWRKRANSMHKLERTWFVPNAWTWKSDRVL